MSMIWHIFKRDWRRLWLLVAMVAAGQLTNAALWFALGNFAEPQGWITTARLFSIAVMFGMITLITTVVHHDVVPGVSQDWLVRPIRRSDLILEKLLFVLITIHAPMFLADLAHGMAAEFPLRDSIAAALSRNVSMLVILSLPTLALATVTKNMAEVMGGIVAIWLVVAVGIVLSVFLRGGTPPPFSGSGIQWMTPAFWSLLALLAAAIVVPLQYFRRATKLARYIVVGTALVAPLLSYSSWAWAFSVQQALSRNPLAANPVLITFDPSLGKSTAETAAPTTDTVLIPLRVSGLAPDSIILNDRAEVRLIGRDGITLFSGRTTSGTGYSDDFPVRTTNGGDVRTHQRIVFPARIWQQVRAQPVRVEIEYSLTLYRIEATETVSAINSDRRLPVFGWCKTKQDLDGDDIKLGCLTAGSVPTCVSATLENARDGTRNPENLFCDPDYAPYQAHVYPDSMNRFSHDIGFRDLQGLARYPVDGSRLADARVILKSYQPVAHFTRHLVIPEIRIGD